MNGYALESCAGVVLANQTVAPVANSVYAVGGDLYFQNGLNQVQITSGSSVNAAAGNITGLASPASVTWSAGTTSYIFKATATDYADLDGRNMLLRNTGAAVYKLTLSPPSAMSSDLTITLPTPPASTSFMTMDNAGTVGVSVPTALGIQTGNLADLAVTTAKINDLAVTTIKIADQNVTPAKRSPANYSTGNTGTVSATVTTTSSLFYSLTLTTSAANKQMMVLFQPYLSGSNINSGTGVRVFIVVVDPASAGTTIRSTNVTTGSPQFQALHLCATSGTYTAQVRVEALAGSTGCNMVDYQLQLVEMG